MYAIEILQCATPWSVPNPVLSFEMPVPLAELPVPAQSMTYSAAAELPLRETPVEG